MAEQNKYEHELPERPATMTDYIRTVGNDAASYMSAIEDLAAAILEQYEGTSLGGAERSPKAAADDVYARVLTDAEFAMLESRLGIGG